MTDNNLHPSDPSSSSVLEFQSKQPIQPEATLQDILDTMHESDFFPRTGKDAPSRFWSAYERVAKQHDDEFIERHNGEMDVLLIFAGLFSAVSSAFIVNMQSSLTPSASDTTNALLKILVNKIDNDTFPQQEAALPVWTGPSSTIIWIQTLAYTSLSSSLLAAFGAVLGKQWVGNFKTSRFGRGALHERCKRRQQKLDGLESWHFSTILATLPIFLQLSLLFFGIALAGNIWTLQHTVASVIMATTAFGLIFYFFTIVSSLKSPDCPFQTPATTVLKHVLQYMVPFRTVVRQKWKGRPKTWGGFLDSVQRTSRCVVCMGRGMIMRPFMHFVSYHLQLLSALRHNVQSTTNDSEAAELIEHSISEAAREHTGKVLALSILDPPVEIAQAHAIQFRAVQWIIETSTDIDIIAAAAGMVPEIEWTATEGIIGMMERLESHLYACFGPTGHILPPAQAQALACLKAICHCSVESDPSIVYPHRDIVFRLRHRLFTNQAYLVVHCAVEDPVELNTKLLPLSDRMWMAHIFTYRLHRGDNNPKFVAFLTDFIDTCLDSKSPTRLAADCVLLAGMLVGLQVDRRHLARLDKSTAISILTKSVLDLMLGVLLGDIPGSQDTVLKLFHPLLQQLYSHNILKFCDKDLLDRVIRFCFHLLNEGPDTMGKDQVRSTNLALLIHITFHNRLSDPRKSFTVAQFDLLMDYHLHICEGTDYDLINATFWMLELGPSNNPERMRRYIDTIIRFMGEETTCIFALCAASAIRVEIASIAQDDESLREDFSKALASVFLLYAKQTKSTYNPFKKISYFVPSRDVPCLQLLRTLAQDSTWRLQLHQNGHFDKCLSIAKTLSSQPALSHTYNYAASVAHIFAIIDASGDETHPFFNTVQAYPRRSLVLQAWAYIFNVNSNVTTHHWLLSRTDDFDILPSLVLYARKQLNNNDEPLITLVEQFCHKLDEEKQQRKQGDTQHIYDGSFQWYEEISALYDQIHALVLDASLTDIQGTS